MSAVRSRGGGTPKSNLKHASLTVDTMPHHDFLPATPSTVASSRTPHSLGSAYTTDITAPVVGKYSPSGQLLPPSPTRARLDAQYSARLHQHQPQCQHDILGPPGLVRGGRSGNISPFRPPAIRNSSSRSDKRGLGSVGGRYTSCSSPSLVDTPRRVGTSSASSPSNAVLGSPASARRKNLGSPIGSPRSSPRVTPRRRSNIANITGGIADTGYSDRFIPSRATSNLDFSVWNAESTDRVARSVNSRGSTRSDNESNESTANRNSNESSSQQPTLNMLLRSELLGENADPAPPMSPGRSMTRMNGATMTLREGGNYLRYQSPRQAFHEEVFGSVSGADGPTSVVNSFNLSPVGSVATQRLLSTPQKRKRKIAKVPFKVLDAPALADDFYLNLVDWSSQNVLAVGLGTCVYLWSACTSKVTKLCDLAEIEDVVTSVAWSQRGTHLAVGTNKGEVQIWDVVKCEKIRTMCGHAARVGTMSWNGPTLATGSRDRLIYLRDVRHDIDSTARLTSHKQEVCGLKWSFDEPAHLASGGNDNKLLVWDIKKHERPVHKFSAHSAAVKAIAWSPHQHGLLASGGGTADRCIRFWNTLSGAHLNCVDTGSQVCNLSWSKNCNEIVSTHGYSLNQIVVWRYPSMSKVTTLTGHTYRVLYLAMSPDGSTIVTGAGDETLRFWQVFPGPRSDDKSSAKGLLFPSSPGSTIR